MDRLRRSEIFKFLVLVVSAVDDCRSVSGHGALGISAPTTTTTTPTAPAASSLTIRGQVILPVLGTRIFSCLAIGHLGQSRSDFKLTGSVGKRLISVGAT